MRGVKPSGVCQAPGTRTMTGLVEYILESFRLLVREELWHGTVDEVMGFASVYENFSCKVRGSPLIESERGKPSNFVASAIRMLIS